MLYNRGVMMAAIHTEAIRNAIKAKGGAKPTSEEVKKGMEVIKDFTLGGMVPPMQITPEDHEGGGWVQVWTVKGGKLVKDGEWFQAYRDVIKKHLAAITDVREIAGTQKTANPLLWVSDFAFRPELVAHALHQQYRGGIRQRHLGVARRFARGKAGSDHNVAGGQRRRQNDNTESCIGRATYRARPT